MRSNQNRFGPSAKARWSILLGIGALTGCAVGPNYHPPQTSVAPAFLNGNQIQSTADAPSSRWWREFNDAQLNEMVRLSLAANQDLRIAADTVREARALRRLDQFDLLPVVNADASYQNNRLSQAALPFIPSNLLSQELYEAGFDAAWEIDVFGRVRRALQASAAEVAAAEANRQDVQLSLISEVARNYFELRGAQNELQVARKNAENQRQTLQITQARLEGGRGTELDVARARAQLNATLSGIPALESAAAAAIYRLGVLAGREPGAFAAQLENPAPIPALPALVNISSPADLLRRRPDVRAAERRLAAATARIGVATADLFPRVTFVGNFDFEAPSFSALPRASSETWSFGPHLTWAALDYGHVRARIKAAGARADAALALYEKTTLIALEETEDALVRFGREQARRQYLEKSVQASESAAALARQRFEGGATDFLTVLDAERVMLEAQDQLAQSETRVATALVALYKALSGGWGDEPPTKTASASR